MSGETGCKLVVFLINLSHFHPNRITCIKTYSAGLQFEFLESLRLLVDLLLQLVSERLKLGDTSLTASNTIHIINIYRINIRGYSGVIDTGILLQYSDISDSYLPF